MSGRNIPLPMTPTSANEMALASRTMDLFTALTGSSVTLSNQATSAPELVFKNGLLLDPSTDYTISGTTVTMTVPLITSDKLHVHYMFRPVLR